MPVVPVSVTQAYAIAGVGTDYSGFTVQNSGTARLYFAHDPSVSSTSYGNFVDPGGSISWPSGSPCYVIADPSGSGQVNYSPLVAALGTDTGGVVSLTPGSQIGISGSVNVNTQVAFLYSQGNVPLPNPVVPIGSIMFDSNSQGIDITPFVSMRFTLDNLNTFGSPPTTPSKVTVRQFAGGILVSAKDYYFLGSGGIDICYPVLGTSVQITCISGVGAATNYQWAVYGYRTAQQPITSIYPNQGGQWWFINYNQSAILDTTGLKGVAGAVGTAALTRILFPHSTGDNLVGVLQGTISLILIATGSATAGRLGSWNGVIQTQAPQLFSLPPYPMEFSTVANFSAGATLNVSVTQERANNNQ